ncbi:MAG: acyl-CoA dehydrogenase family protein [Acidimicrobiales bacterium]|nr:acyl-CoA dehydrogenase family protein [Acidimicrobiales bacterium]
MTDQMDHLDADDLAMLATSFESAMAAAPDPSTIDQALFELGWPELLEAAPTQGAATVFTALGATGTTSGALDDVLAHALGLDVSATTGVALPPTQRTTTPARRDDEQIVVDGLVSPRIDTATSIVLAVASDQAVELVRVDPSKVDVAPVGGIDPDGGHRRLRATIAAADTNAETPGGTWPGAVAAAQVALAHQLVASSRWMLDQAREHALERVQFGRAIASFQAIRHKLSETLVQIEGAASVAGACTDDSDPMLAALAKSLAGSAARTASKHAQQVLAGIGFTTEHDFQRWMKRTVVIEGLFGSASSLPTTIGEDLLARGTAPRLFEL